MKSFILWILFFSVPALATEWSGLTAIKQIYPHSTNNSDGTIYLKFDKMINPAKCQHGHLVALKKNNQLSSQIYSLILASAMAGKPISYYIIGCDAHGFPELHHALTNF